MSEGTKIILIRHGETEWNLTGRWQGHADSPLSERGVSQAVALGERMKAEELDYFYSSDLERAQHTARLVGEPSGWRAILMESLRELDLGVLEGLTTEEMVETNPDEYKSFRENGPEYQVPGGESFHQFYNRCAKALEEIAGKHPGKKIGVVTHGGFLGAIFRYILKIPLEAERNFLLLNCSVNRLEKTKNGWNLVSWGDIAHLDGLAALDDA
jgi:2,3-bisphosphoglycerate-dependent phosphoglycerate mutase